MVVGYQEPTVGQTSYSRDPMYQFAKAFTEAAQNILSTETYDIYAEPARATRSASVKEALREFFTKDVYDPENTTMGPEAFQEAVDDMNQMFENDIKGIQENTYQSEYSPMMGMAVPIHKYILMNNVFSQGGGIQRVTAAKPSFTVSVERRILVAADGTEVDMFYEQNQIFDTIEASAPTVEMEISLPETETTNVVAALGGSAMDELSTSTHISGIYVQNVYFAEGDRLPDADGWVSNKGKIAEAADAGLKDVWYHVNIEFTPTYGDRNRLERAFSKPVSIKYKSNAAGTIVELSDTLFGAMHNNKLTITAVKGNVKKVMLAAKLNTSNAMLDECSVRWKLDTDYVEIPEATPINTTVSPEEVKDIAALYDANQVTKIMSMTKTALSEYKDKKIYNFLNDSYERLDERRSFFDEFDFAVPEGYALDYVTHRAATFSDFFDDYVTRMFQVWNDPNVTVTIYGDPRIIRRITPSEWTYQAPSNIGAVQLDYTLTVVDTKDHRVYNYVGTDKMRNTNELMVILNPVGSERIMYRLYDYQLYISNEIRNSQNQNLPAIHSFDRFRMYSQFEVQGRVQILHPSGKIK
jgi:hypothetical protein